MSATPKAAHVWKRDPHDWYVEPTRATVQLLARETFDGWIHDPFCGGGNIVQTLLDAGHVATGSDLVRRTAADWFAGEADFFNGPHGCFGAPNVVSNPPFYKAVGAERATRDILGMTSGKVAVFVEARFLGGSGRARGLFHETPPNRIWVITPRPSCPPGAYLAAGGKAGNGSSDWLWLVWDPGETRLPPGASPQLGWLT